MLYETLNQPQLLFYYIILGFCSGLFFDAGNFIKFLCSNKKFANIIFDIISTSLVMMAFIAFNGYINYGIIRLALVLSFATSFTIERFTLGKLLAKFYTSCYNAFERIIKRIKKTKKDETNKNN